MEVAKKRAVQEEDFDNALSVKNEIQKLRQALLQKMSQDGFAIDSAGEIVLQTVLPAQAGQEAPSFVSKDSGSLPGSGQTTAAIQLARETKSIVEELLKEKKAESIREKKPIDLTDISMSPTRPPERKDEPKTFQEGKPESTTIPPKVEPVATSPGKDSKKPRNSLFQRSKETSPTSQDSSAPAVGSSSPKPLIKGKEKPNRDKSEEPPSKQVSPGKAAKQNDVKNGAYNSDERSIVVKPVTYDAEAFDEFSVPPGLAPSRNMKGRPADKKKNQTEAEKEKPRERKASEQQPPSPNKSPAPQMKTFKKKIEAPPAPASKSKPVKNEEIEEKHHTENKYARPTLNANSPFTQHPTSNYDVEDLPGIAKTEFSDSIFLFGEHLIACLLGKQFTAREWALTEVARLVDEASDYITKYPDELDQTLVIRGIYAVIGKGISDTREKVISNTLQIWTNAIGKCIP